MPQRKSENSTRVLITGAGLNGLSMALGLAQRGFSCVILDRTPLEDMQKPAFDGRTTAVAAGMKNMLMHLGVWDDMAGHAGLVQTIEVRDGSARPLIFDTAEPMGYILLNEHLRASLLKALQGFKHIRFVSGQLENIQRTPHGFDLKTTGGTISGEFLIGADGRESFVRKWARIPRKTWDYNHTAQVFLIRHEDPHHNTAHEIFLPDGPLAVLPMKDPHTSQVVWSVQHEQVPALKSLGDGDFLGAFNEAFRARLGDVTLASPRLAYPLNYTHAYRYTAERLALVGDAAHGIHPIAGQGLNLGMRDVAAFLELLDQFSLTDPEFLKRYERRRRMDVTTMVFMTDSLTRLFGVRFQPLAKVRQLGISLVGKFPPLQDFFIRRAMGTGSEMPKYFQG